MMNAERKIRNYEFSCCAGCLSDTFHLKNAPALSDPSKLPDHPTRPRSKPALLPYSMRGRRFPKGDRKALWSRPQARNLMRNSECGIKFVPQQTKLDEKASQAKSNDHTVLLSQYTRAVCSVRTAGSPDAPTVETRTVSEIRGGCLRGRPPTINTLAAPPLGALWFFLPGRKNANQYPKATAVRTNETV